MKDRADEIERLKERVDDIDRRQFLKAAGVAGGTAGAVGVIWYGTRDDESPETPPPDDDEPPETPPPDDDEPPDDTPPDGPPDDEVPYEDDFETVVDVIDEGVDDEGNEPINELFREYTGDDTLFVFDSGTFQIDPIQFSNRTKLGFVNDGDERATFIPNNDGCRGGNPYYHFDDIEDLVIDGIDFDFRDVDSGGPVHLFLQGDSILRNFSYVGSCSNQLGIARIEVSDPTGTALVENFEAGNTDDNQTLTGVYVSDGHAGELTFRNCALNEFSDNGIYASAPGGPNGNDGIVHVIGGTFRNNNISNVRLGSTGATADSVTVIVDDETPGWGQLNSRGIRLRNKENQEIRNCEIRFGPEAADSFGGIVFHQANGGARIVDTVIEINRDNIPAFRAFAPEHEPDSAPTFENVTVTGQASAGPVAEIAGRNGTTFQNCTIEQSSGNRRGFVIENSPNCRFEDCYIEVADRPVQLNSSSVTLENTRIVTERGERLFEREIFEDEEIEL